MLLLPVPVATVVTVVTVFKEEEGAKAIADVMQDAIKARLVNFMID